MLKKYEIVETKELSNDIIVILAKKKKEETKKCSSCMYCKFIKETNEHICIRYRALVKPNDECIEVGM